MDPYEYLLTNRLQLKFIKIKTDVSYYLKLTCLAKNLDFGVFREQSYKELFYTLTYHNTDRYIAELQPFVKILKMFPAELSSKTEVDVLWVLNGLNNNEHLNSK